MRSMNARRLALICVLAAAMGSGFFPGGTLASAHAQQSAPNAALSAEEVVRRLEERRVYETSRAEMSMTISDRFGTRESTMIAWSRGTDEALIEFTSAAERGQKILRTADEIYLYYPDAAELVRLQGAALRESMLGSDVSYEDLTGGKTLLDTYKSRWVDGKRSTGMLPTGLKWRRAVATSPIRARRSGWMHSCLSHASRNSTRSADAC